jgi:KTSC domain
MNVSRAPVLLCLGLLSIALASAEPDAIVRSRIRRTPVHSSNVASAGYSFHLRALEIEFVRGAIYRFLNVPPRISREFFAAESKGRFIAERLRGKYEFVRVRPHREEVNATDGWAGKTK